MSLSATRIACEEFRECAECHNFVREGYILKSESGERFVCGDCHDAMGSTVQDTKCTVEVSRDALLSVVPESGAPRFKAGYLIGKREEGKVRVTALVEGEGSGQGTVRYFCTRDIMQLRRMRGNGDEIVGIFRTSPSGEPNFNELDERTFGEMLQDIVYMVIGSANQAKITVRHKKFSPDELGVICV